MSTPITRDSLRKAVREAAPFQKVPTVTVPVITMMNDDNMTFRDLANVIEVDPELSARIMTIANSGFYGFKKKIRTINHALVLLGWNTVKMIALGSSLLRRMCLTDRELYNHSMRAAQIARFLAMEANFYKVEEIAMVTLLHDIGKMILEMYFPDEYGDARTYAVDNGVPQFIAEREILGLDHATVGGWVLEDWMLPENITESVALHHAYDEATYHHRKTAVIHVADCLAHAVNFRGPATEKVPELKEGALEPLGFSHTELRDHLLTIMKMRLDPLIV